MRRVPEAYLNAVWKELEKARAELQAAREFAGRLEHAAEEGELLRMLSTTERHLRGAEQALHNGLREADRG